MHYITLKAKQVRKLRGYTQEELSEKLQLSRTTISQIEAGNKNVKLSTIEKYIQVLGIELSEILEVKEDFSLLID